MKNITEKRDTGDIPFVKNPDGSTSFFMSLATGSFDNREYTYQGEQTAKNYAITSSQTESEYKQNIRKAVFYYNKDAIVYQCVSMLSQLANDNFKISCEDKESELVIKTWWKDIRGNEFLKYFFLEYFRSGNVPILKSMIPYIPKEINNKKSSIVAKNSNTILSEIKNYKNLTAEQKILLRDKFKNNSIPAFYTLLNPLNVRINTFSKNSNAYYSMVVSSEFKKMMDLGNNVFGMIPEEIKSKALNGDYEVEIPNYLFDIIYKEKQPYESWANPTVSHCFDSLDFKQEIREMDKATVRGVKNRILKVTIGSDQFPVTDNKELKTLATAFKNPSKNLTIFWNHTLNIEYIEPTLDTLNAEKYNLVNSEILSCFGIAQALIGENSGNTGNNVLNMKGLIEKLDNAQTSFCDWFDGELENICNVIGIDKIPESGFGKLNLKDENAFIGVIMQMVDRQIISYETAIETIGFYFPKELDRLRREKKIRDKEEILKPQVAPTQQASNSTPSKQEGRPSSPIKEGNRPKAKDKPKSPSKTKSISSESFIKKCIDSGYESATSKKQIQEVSSILEDYVKENIQDEKESSIAMVKIISASSDYMRITGNKDLINVVSMVIDSLSL
ncbi:MAG: hypothetical protein M0P71_01460 [Melioribacteraceae bacterium]|nr:hypothetical protein [Melioribacteraceae bacterium]